MHAQSLQSCLTLCNPMDCSHQASLSMEFSRQEHWSGLPGQPPGDLPDLEIEPVSPATPALQEYSLPISHLGSLCVTESMCVCVYINTYIINIYMYI